MTLSEQILNLTFDPNLIGELLRDKFFDQDRGKGKFGCYSTFDLRPGVEKLPDSIIDTTSNWLGWGGDAIETKEIWTVARLDDVIMRYFWDGDGILQFEFPNGSKVTNFDCKKSYGWDLV